MTNLGSVTPMQPDTELYESTFLRPRPRTRRRFRGQYKEFLKFFRPISRTRPDFSIAEVEAKLRWDISPRTSVISGTVHTYGLRKLIFEADLCGDFACVVMVFWPREGSFGLRSFPKMIPECSTKNVSIWANYTHPQIWVTGDWLN